MMYRYTGIYKGPGKRPSGNRKRWVKTVKWLEMCSFREANASVRYFETHYDKIHDELCDVFSAASVSLTEDDLSPTRK